MSTETTTPSPYSRKNPFPGSLLVNRLLSKSGSGKEIRHFEIDLRGSGLTYETGDSAGIFPDNDPALVEEIITALGATGEEPVPSDKDGPAVPLRQALLRNYHITSPSKQFLEAIAARTEGNSVIKDLLADPLRKDDLAKYTYGMEVIDFLLAHPSIKFTAEEFIATLRKLQPRLYSISSSLRLHPEQVHLTIATVRYESHGRQRKGIASTFLAERAEPLLRGHDQVRWIEQLTAERDNLLATLRFAVEASDAATGVRLVAALSWYWTLLGRHDEASTAFERVRSLRPSDAGAVHEQALALRAAG